MSRLVPRTTLRPHALATLGALTLTTVAMLASPTDAPAAQPYGPTTPYEKTTLYYRLSDLATDQGTRALYRRIAGAAVMVCPPENLLEPNETAVSRECQRQAIARAVAKIGNARLTAIAAHWLAPYR